MFKISSFGTLFFSYQYIYYTVSECIISIYIEFILMNLVLISETVLALATEELKSIELQTVCALRQNVLLESEKLVLESQKNEAGKIANNVLKC